MHVPPNLLDEIKEQNLSYLVLAQRMLREDRAEGMYRLGISVELAEVIENFTLAQVVKLSATPVLLCRLRFDDHAVLSALVDKRTSALERMAAIHQAIVLAGEPVEGMA